MHLACILQWLRVPGADNKCPLCRQQIIFVGLPPINDPTTMAFIDRVHMMLINIGLAKLVWFLCGPFQNLLRAIYRIVGTFVFVYCAFWVVFLFVGYFMTAIMNLALVMVRIVAE